MDRTATFYSGPSYLHGAGMPVFSGSRRQRGGSIFGAIKNFFLPILKGFGKKVVKRGASEAVGLAKDVVKDAFMFKNVNDSVKQHGKKRALGLTKYAAQEGLDTLEKMIGSGRKRRRVHHSRKRRKVRRSRKRLNTQSLRKRRRSTKRSKPRKKQRRHRTTKSLF